MSKNQYIPKKKSISKQNVTFEGNQTVKGNMKGSVSPDKHLSELKIKKINTMHKTSVEQISGSNTTFPKLPGLVIKGQGGEMMPVSDRINKLSRTRETPAYALSPKLVRQLNLVEKFQKKKETDPATHANTEGLTVQEINRNQQ